ncbi:hypothetical protein JYU34_004442 [Plutella xylostella]|uniref:FLYWCH-type domain-containing protein n=1 Tax=Plutella xylostella TaxID=51655 RepID=A0ABQ7QY12_PLUXY|nr:hypothetical protein JYU34_004442 [Plutella xylostella]
MLLDPQTKKLNTKTDKNLPIAVPEFGTSARGYPMLTLGGFKYSLCPRSRGCVKLRWVCTKWRWRGCRASLRTVDSVVVAVTNQHNHDNTS